MSKRLLPLLVVVLAGSLLTAACSFGDDSEVLPPEPTIEETEPDPEPQPAPEPEPAPEPAQTDGETRIAVTFDGTSCLYTAPETVAAGRNDFAFENQSDTVAWAALWPVAEGFTAEEVLAELGESGMLPLFSDQVASGLGLLGLPGPFANLDVGRERDVNQHMPAGEYVIVCGSADETTNTPTDEYFTAGSVVVE